MFEEKGMGKNYIEVTQKTTKKTTQKILALN